MNGDKRNNRLRKAASPEMLCAGYLAEVAFAQ